MKRLALVAVVAALLVVGTSCSTFQPEAATVNGTTIKRADFEDILRLYKADQAFAVNQNQQGRSIEGNGDQTVGSQFAARVLNQEIIFVIVRAELNRRGVVVNDNDRAQARTDLQQSFDNTNSGPQQIWEAFTKRVQDKLVQLAAELNALRDAVGNIKTDDASLQAVFDKDPSQYSQYCVSQIVASTEAAANALKQRLAQGADFATLAKSDSVDASTAADGGALGCGTRSQLVQAFGESMRTAQAKVVLGPFPEQAGFAIVEITSIQPTSFADAKAGVRNEVVSGAETPLNDFLSNALKAAKVTIDPRYGTWNATLGTVTANA